MKRVFLAIFLATVAVCTAHTQPTPWAYVHGQNARMTALQPTWMAPLIQSDSRMGQAIRLSVSQATLPGERVISYGNNHGIDVLAGTRWQLEAVPPSFFRNHSSQFHDGWGNALAEVKYRIASGNEEHGNFALTAIFAQGFAPRAYQNQSLTAYSIPKLAVGKALGSFNLQTVVDGVLPAGKIAQQGRIIEWNTTAQFHTTSRTWLDIENNAAFIRGSPLDGRTQNFLTPAGFFLLKENGWGFSHPALVFDGGMQIATSHFSFYNHNLITEVRILF